MQLYKLTDETGHTYGQTRWEIGGVVKAAEGPPQFCTSTVLHAYTSPLLAELMNPAHGGFTNPRYLTVEGEIVASDGTKVGAKMLTVTGTYEPPHLTIKQKVAFGILCAQAVYEEAGFNTWAEAWLSGRDQSAAAADAAYVAARAASASYADDYADGYALSAAAAAYARAAASAADAAAYVANSAAADAAYAASAASYAATCARTASAAGAVAATIDFQALAEKALLWR